MRGGNSLKRAIVAGFIAGLASGIVFFISRFNGWWDLFSFNPFAPPFNIQKMASYDIIMGITWGIIWGILYAIFYDFIPSKGIGKGLFYGLIVWTISILRGSVVSAAYGWFNYAVPYTLSGFISICIIYGLLIGYLYKPTK